MGLTQNLDIVELRAEIAELKRRVSHFEELLASQSDLILELPDDSWDVVRKKRDFLLMSTDWTAINGCTVDTLEWTKYRQILRDLPQTFANVEPNQVVWPQQPSKLAKR